MTHFGLGKRWQPLTESDNLGFLFNQEHVVPHIGFTGRAMYLSPEYFCSLSVEDPQYDYQEESELLFDRLAALNDTLKGEIELFDDKDASIINLFGVYVFVTNIFGTFDYFLAQSGVFDVAYNQDFVLFFRQIYLQSQTVNEKNKKQNEFF